MDANFNMKRSRRHIHQNTEVGLPEFESESLAPKAKRIDQATPQAQNIFFGNIIQY